MSETRRYTVLGDSNVTNNMNKTNCRAHPDMKKAQVVPCGNINLLSPSLVKLKPDVTMCILSCLTNFLTSSECSTSVVLGHRVEPVLRGVLATLHDHCSSHPDRFVFVSPPMYRSTPVWYREGLAEILSLFSQIFSADRPDGLILLPSFPKPDFQADGVHLTPYSGLEFLLHLFDSASDALQTLSLPLPDLAQKSSESTRLLEDRVMVLEQDHRRLDGVVEAKSAADAELFDFRENERFEDYFIIAGLPRLSPDLVGKVWQDQAVLDVQAALRLLMGREYNIIVVHNSTRRVPDAEVTYTVRLSSVEDSRAIRTKFGSYFIGGDRRPDSIKHLSIKNRVTSETKIRIDILKLIAKRYRDANPGSRVKVCNSDLTLAACCLPSEGFSLFISILLIFL